MPATRGFLRARFDGEEYFFDGSTWSGPGRQVQFLNDIRDEWDIFFCNLEEKARTAFNSIIPGKEWEILEVKPDLTDPMAGDYPEGTVS